MVLNKDDLEGNHPFEAAMKQMLKHEVTCDNQTCKQNGWDKMKVIDVEYIGLTDADVINP